MAFKVFPACSNDDDAAAAAADDDVDGNGDDDDYGDDDDDMSRHPLSNMCASSPLLLVTIQ